MKAFSTVFARDLRVAFRRLRELANPLLFFVIVVSLFPLALSPNADGTARRRNRCVVGVGVAILAARAGGTVSRRCRRWQLGAAPVEPRSVRDHGARESHRALADTMVPLIASCLCSRCRSLAVHGVADVLAFALLLATPMLSVLVALGAALTVSLRRGGSMVGLARCCR